MDAERSIVDLVACAWRVGLLDPRWLPEVAAELIVAGVDPPSVVELAGLDFAPFDPRDAGDLLVAALGELDLPPPDDRHTLVTMSLFMAWAAHTGRLLSEYAARWAYRTDLAYDFASAPHEFTKLYVLGLEYTELDHGYWQRSAEDVDRDVGALFDELLDADANADARPAWTVQPPPDRILDLILPSV